MNLIVTSLFIGPNTESIIFPWDRIGHHSTIFNTEYNYTDAQVLLQLSLMVSEAAFAKKSLDPPSWLHDTELIYDSCPNIIIHFKFPHSKFNKPSILGHILYNEQGNILFIVFTATNNVCLATLDLDHYQTELSDILNYNSGVKGHKGIYMAYQSIRPKLIQTLLKYTEKNPQIIVTGHSLGGGLSQLCALDLAFYNPIHYSFASPLIFNPKGAEIFDNLVKYSYRIANLSDLVVISPLPVMPNGDSFCHVGKLVYFQRNLGNYKLNHSYAYAQEYNLI